ncbi:MAG: nicotinate (nicotinamide) nucleotide adenylyltransferase [Mariprofundales bacterium]
MNIVLYGGSFDPPHLGHMACALAALHHLPIKQCLVMPVGIPVHRSLSQAVSGMKRLNWLRTMFAQEPCIDVLDWEVCKHTPSPTIDTLKQLKTHSPQANILLLLGEDAFASMASWVSYPDHYDICSVVVLTRYGFENSNHYIGQWQESSVAAWQAMPSTGRVLRLNVALPDISATQIRQWAVLGKSLSGLVEPSLEQEIANCYNIGQR